MKDIDMRSRQSVSQAGQHTVSAMKTYVSVAQEKYELVRGEYDPLKAYGWALHLRDHTEKSHITQLHEFYSHPILCSRSNCLIYEELVNYNHFLSDHTRGAAIIELYRPLFEGAVLASCFLNYPKQAAVYSEEIVDERTRALSVGLLRMRQNLLHLASEPSSLAFLPGSLADYISKLKHAEVAPGHIFGASARPDEIIVDVEYLAWMPVNMSMFLSARRDYLRALLTINNDLESALRGTSARTKEKERLYDLVFRSLASVDTLKMAFLAACLFEIQTRPSPDVIGFVLHQFFNLLRQILVFWVRTKTGTINILTAEMELLGPLRYWARKMAAEQIHPSTAPLVLNDGFYHNCLHYHAMRYLLRELLAGDSSRLSASETVAVIYGALEKAIGIVLSLYDDFRNGAYRSRYFEILFKTLLGDQQVVLETERKVWGRILASSSRFLKEFDSERFRNMFRLSCEAYFGESERLMDAVYLVNKRNLGSIWRLEKEASKRLLSIIVFDENSNLVARVRDRSVQA